MFKTLDDILEKRKMPAPPMGLSARIIAQAKTIEQEGAVQKPLPQLIIESLNALVESIFPQPQTALAYGLVAFVLVSGFLIGTQSESFVDLQMLSTSDVADIMEIEDSYKISEWV